MSTERVELDTAAVWQAVREILPLVAGWLLIVAGAVVLSVGWFGISGEALVARQLPYLVSGGLGGLALVVVGAAVIGSRDVRAVGGRLETLERQVADLHAALLQERTRDDGDGERVGITDPTHDPRSAAAQDAAADRRVLVLPQGERFHAAGCPIVADKDGVERLSRAEADERGFAPCRLCDAPSLAP